MDCRETSRTSTNLQQLQGLVRYSENPTKMKGVIQHIVMVPRIRRELSFSLLESSNSRLNIVILPLIRGEKRANSRNHNCILFREHSENTIRDAFRKINGIKWEFFRYSYGSSNKPFSLLELKGELQYLGENYLIRGEKMTILV